MGKKSMIIDYSNPPETLDEHPFYGFKLDENQKAFRDYIWAIPSAHASNWRKAHIHRTGKAKCVSELVFTLV